jgi:hypothetical protein
MLTRAWHTLLGFGDAHPWFLPSLAAIFTLLGVLYRASATLRRLLRGLWESFENDVVAGYLMRQVNIGELKADSHGISPRRQKNCSLLQVASSLHKKPHKTQAILERLKQQLRVESHGNTWCATDYQLGQVSGSLTA